MFKKSASLKERANAALASVQRNAYAMGMLRSKLESRINYALCEKGSTERCEELTKVLQLVKNGELILHEISEKIESARFLEEFVTIMDNAALSVSEIKGDLEQMVPAAEAALEEIHDAITKVSTGLASEIREEIEPAILAEVTVAIAASKASTSANLQDTEREQEKQEEPEPVPA